MDRVFRNIGEEHSLGGHAALHIWRESAGLSQSNVHESLAVNHKHDEAKIDPGYQGVCKVSRRAADITEAYNVQSGHASTSSRIDWNQGWPGDAAANECDYRQHLGESQEEVVIQRR